MSLYKSFLFPLLSRQDAETVHERTLLALSYAQAGWLRPLLKRISGQIPVRPVRLWGLTFPNVLGMAAGFDKEVRVAKGLGALGFGHVEVGTLTPRPQAGNARPRIFRLKEDQALINRMGFPNEGVGAALPNLMRLATQDRSFILGVSLGKQKETDLVEAVADYVSVMQQVFAFADYLAVNISSPNTPGLRDLQGGNYLAELLTALAAENGRLAQRHRLNKRPLLVKIAPDLSESELDAILDVVLDAGVDGIIATNTTLDRSGLTAPQQREAGGLSGRPVRLRSSALIARIQRQTNGALPIIGVGGIFTAADIQEKLDAGASLVQLYTALIYEGPGLAGRLLRALERP